MSGKVSKPRPSIKKPPASKAAKKRVEIQSGKILCGVIAALITASFAVAGCLQDGGTVVESLNCLGLPTIPKFSDPRVFLWKGKEILSVNDGNEIRLFDIANPHSPRAIATSNFNIGNQGDSDYDLMNYTTGDDVRFHVATFKRGNVVFDLGAGNWPAFGARQFYVSGGGPLGGAAFVERSDFGDGHYIVAQNLPGSLGYSGTIYRVVDPSQLVVSGYVDAGLFKKITHGWKLWNGAYYLSFSDGSIHLFKWQPTALTLKWIVKTPIVGSGGTIKGISIKGKKVLAASPVTNGTKYWKIEAVESPELLSTFQDKFLYSAANWTNIFIARMFEVTFDTTLPRAPVPLDQYFWDPIHPWNHYSDECTFPSGAVFSRNGEVLYYARWSVVHMVDFSGCSSPTPTPTPTPPPWPTPFPTCVPNCTSVN